MSLPEDLLDRHGRFSSWIVRNEAGKLIEEDAQRVVATRFRWRNPAEIPPRTFLYGRHAIRGFVSVTAAISGLGKTSLALAESMALGTGRNLLGVEPAERAPVWYLGLEDPLDEYERRVTAIALHFDIPGTEIEECLFLDSGRDQNFVLAVEERSGTKIIEPILGAIIENIRKNQIGQIIVDPFVACHAVSENDNSRLEKVTRAWAQVANEAGCAVELIHHFRKTGGPAEPTADDVRGASAIVGAARSVRILAGMTKEEAEAAGVEERFRFFRVISAKANLFPRSETSDWYQLRSVSLGNGAGRPDDHVGVVSRWQWPNAFDGLHVSDIAKVQDTIAAGEWAENVQANNWAGRAIASVLSLSPDDKSDKARIKSLLRTWIDNGALKVERMHSNRDGRERPMIIVGNRT